MLFAAWFGVVIFPPNTMEGSEELPNFREAAWQLIVTLTTANFPDVMLPAYERNRWPATLFFGSFLALGMFFMMNLLLATVWKSTSTASGGRSYGDNVASMARGAEVLISTQASDGLQHLLRGTRRGFDRKG